MASESFISYKEKGFYIVDDFVILIARYLIETYKKNEKNAHWRSLMKDDLLTTAIGGYSLSLHLDKYLDNDYKFKDYINWIQQTKEFLKLKGEFIDIDELNSFDKLEMYSVYEFNIKTNIMINLFDDLILIVENKGEDKESKKILPYLKN